MNWKQNVPFSIADGANFRYEYRENSILKIYFLKKEYFLAKILKIES
jgi:hypothetical protein